MIISRSNKTGLRSFIALPVPTATANELRKLEQRLQPQLPADSRWTAPNNLHVTLAFLGNQHPEKLEELAHSLTASLTRFLTFRLTLSRIHPFPDTQSRILAATADDNQALNQLHRKIIENLKKLAIRFDQKPFRPHVTMARCKQHLLMPEMAISIPLLCDQIIIFSSQMDSNGAQYTAEYTITLPHK